MIFFLFVCVYLYSWEPCRRTLIWLYTACNLKVYKSSLTRVMIGMYSLKCIPKCALPGMIRYSHCHKLNQRSENQKTSAFTIHLSNHVAVHYLCNYFFLFVSFYLFILLAEFIKYSTSSLSKEKFHNQSFLFNLYVKSN